MSYMRILGVLGLIGIIFIAPAYGEEGIASWYSRGSIAKEGLTGMMANGEVFDDQEKVYASWFYRLGRYLRVINLSNKRSVIVRVTDRGPSRRLVRQGRIIDLSKNAFKEIGALDKGLIRVRIEPLK